MRHYSPNLNPSNLGDGLGQYTQGDAGQVVAAVAAATDAFPAWSMGGIQARSEALEKIGAEILARKEELGTLLTREEGKTKTEGIGEAARAAQIKFFAGACVCRVKSFHRCSTKTWNTSRSARPRVPRWPLAASV